VKNDTLASSMRLSLINAGSAPKSKAFSRIMISFSVKSAENVVLGSINVIKGSCAVSYTHLTLPTSDLV